MKRFIICLLFLHGSLIWRLRRGPEPGTIRSSGEVDSRRADKSLSADDPGRITRK